MFSKWPQFKLNYWLFWEFPRWPEVIKRWAKFSLHDKPLLTGLKLLSDLVLFWWITAIDRRHQQLLKSLAKNSCHYYPQQEQFLSNCVLWGVGITFYSSPDIHNTYSICKLHITNGRDIVRCKSSVSHPIDSVSAYSTFCIYQHWLK